MHRKEFFPKNCVEFITGRKCKLELRCNSSSARAFCHCGCLWLQELVQKGEVAVKPVGTWRSTADLSTKIQGKKRIKVLLNLMGYVDTHNDYYPVGEQERLEDEQKELEKKAMSLRRIQQANAKGAYKAFRILLVQAMLEGGSVVAQSGLESSGLEAQCGEPTTLSRSTQMPLMWMIATCIIILALLARWAYKQLRRAQGELEQRLTNLDAHQELDAATREASTRT